MRSAERPRALLLTLGIFAAALLCAAPADAVARTLACGHAAADAIQVDGNLGDWQGGAVATFAERRFARGEWDGERDLSFTLRCTASPATVYLALEIRDDFSVRTPRATPAEDHVVVRVGGRRFTLFPADLKRHPQKLVGAPRGVQAAEGAIRHGYAVELALPRRAFPALARHAPSVPLEVTVVDGDSRVARREKSRMSTGTLTLTFEGARALVDTFLLNRGLKASAVRCDRTADLGGDGRVERVVVADRFLAVLGGSLGDNYYYQSLPYADGKDLRGCEIADLTGDRKAEVILRYIERGGGGSRLIYAVYRFEEEKLRRVFAQELEKQLGALRLTNRIAVRPARRGRGRELEVSVGEAHGVTASNWRERPAEDVSPILLPWGPRKKAVFRWTGDVFAAD